jgi:hypothetical protein
MLYTIWFYEERKERERWMEGERKEKKKNGRERGREGHLLKGRERKGKRAFKTTQ